MRTINDRINELIEVFCNNNNSTFANKIGISEANVRNYRNGTEPKFSAIEKIARNFEINYEWLIKGEGEMRKAENNNVAPPSQSEREQYENTIRLLKSIIKDKEEIIRLLRDSKKDDFEMLPVSMVAEEGSNYPKKSQLKNTKPIQPTQSR